MMPAFSLISRRGDHAPLLVEMIKRSGIAPEDFALEKIIRPYVSVLAFLLLEEGIHAEGHTQNILFEVTNDSELTGRIILRDLSDMSVDIAHRIARGKALPDLHCVVSEPPPFPLATVAGGHRSGWTRTNAGRAWNTVERYGLRGFVWAVNTSLARFFPRYCTADVERAYLRFWQEETVRSLEIRPSRRKNRPGIEIDEALRRFHRRVAWRDLGADRIFSVPRTVEQLQPLGVLPHGSSKIQRIESPWGDLLVAAGLPAFFAPHCRAATGTIMHPKGVRACDLRMGTVVSNRTISRITDSDLLGHYVAGGSEGAFREVVHRYQNLVVGVALRKCGDMELARDVAQQVFAALARKASLLIGRVSLAGWLHQAAMYETCRAIQAESRRRARHELFAAEEPIPHLNSPCETKEWAVLDEEIDRLSFADREAIAMHYFQEISYIEMAVMLGAAEPAVRKRVSRALQRLGERLRERGVKQTAVAMLAGAVAIQNALVVPSGLAQAALALATAGGGASVFLTLTALFSKGIVKTAAMLAAASVIYTVCTIETPGRNEDAQPSALVATESRVDPAVDPLPLPASSPSTFAQVLPSEAPDRTVGARRTAAPPNGATVLTPVAAVATNPQRDLPPARRVEVAQNTEQRRARPVVQGSPVFAPAIAPANAPSAITPASEALSNAALSLGENLLEPGSVEMVIANLLDEIPDLPEVLQQLELLPSEAADFYDSVLSEALVLTPVESSRVREVLEDHFVDRAIAGVAGPRPESIAEVDWVNQRFATVVDTASKVVEAIPDAGAVHEWSRRCLASLTSRPASRVRRARWTW
jgi:RNA polymerase sigma factor (sigma-70 family)